MKRVSKVEITTEDGEVLTYEGRGTARAEAIDRMPPIPKPGTEHGYLSVTLSLPGEALPRGL